MRNNPNLEVFQCEECSLAFLSDFSHLKENFYEEGCMYNQNQNFWIENTKTDDLRRYEYFKNLFKNKKILDFGAGAGGFVRLNNCDGLESDLSLQEFFKGENLNIYSSLSQVKEKYDFITMFHVLEHLENPKQMLGYLSDYLKKDGRIIIEVPNLDDILLLNKTFKDFYYINYHFFYYNMDSLSILLEKANFKIEKKFFVQRYNFLNHLYWFVKKQPRGHIEWKNFNIAFVDKIYQNILKFLKKTDTILVIVKKI